MVACSIPGQGTELGCRAIPDRGTCGRQPTDLSLSLSLPLPLKSITISSGEDLKKKEEEETEL